MLQIEMRRKRKPKQVFDKAVSAIQEAWEAIPDHWKKMLCGPVTVVIFEGRFTSLTDVEVQERIRAEPPKRGAIGTLIHAKSWDEVPGCYLSDVRRIYLKLEPEVEYDDAYYFQSYFLASVATALWDDNEGLLFDLCHPAFVEHLNLEGWVPSREGIARANPDTDPEKLDEFYVKMRKDACRRLFNRVASLFWFNPRYLEKKWYSIAPFMGELDQSLRQKA